MVGRVAFVFVPAAAIAGLVLLLNKLHADAGIAVASLGMAAVILGTVLGSQAHRLPELPRPQRPRSAAPPRID
jgi:hypothetical protein